jgi:NAD-dependent deacetylase
VRVIVLSGSGLSAGSGLPTFRGAGGVYEGMTAEAFLSAASYARDPEAVEAWLDGLRGAGAAAVPNRAHVALAEYQARHAGVVLCTQNVDTLLERAGAREVVHLHGRLDRLRCLGHAHPVPLGAGTRRDAPARCPACGSRLRSDVVLFGEPAPAYATLDALLRRARPEDALVVVGTQGNVLPVDAIARGFPGLRLLNNLHASPWIDAAGFHDVFEAPAAEAIDAVLAAVDAWRAARAG